LDQPYTVEKGERIAQGLFVPIVLAGFTETNEASEADRGGFGTTG